MSKLDAGTRAIIRASWFVSVVVAVGVGTIALGAYTNYRQSKDIKEILSFVDNDIVESWDIVPAKAEYTVGEGIGIELDGTFVCSAEVKQNPVLLQFTSALIPVDAMKGPSVPRIQRPPVDSTTVCVDMPVMFSIPWSELEAGLQSMTGPTAYFVRYGVSSNNLNPFETVSGTFIIIRPAD